MTEDEWEQRERQTSLLSAGVAGLQEILQPALKKAAIVQQDAKQGMMPSQAYNVENQPK